MSEAFAEVLRFTFEENRVFRLTTGCDPENKGSEKVMKKCGLVKEADMKKKSLDAWENEGSGGIPYAA